MICEQSTGSASIIKNQDAGHYAECISKDNVIPVIGHSWEIITLKKAISDVRPGRVFFINGEPGCEIKSVAWYVFHQNRNQYERFIHLSPLKYSGHDFTEHLMTCIDRGRHCVFYVSDLDVWHQKKSMDLQTCFLSDALRQKLLARNNLLLIHHGHCFPDQYKNTESGEQWINDVCIYVPPLRDRKNDIVAHIQFIASEFNMDINVSHSAMDLLENYDWPGNVVELHEMILNLVLSYGCTITDIDVLSIDSIRNSRLFPNRDLIHKIMASDVSGYNTYHPRVTDAIEYLSHHFLENIMMNELAEAASISPSHLSYLFRKCLNTSFKSILCQVRVCFAQELIRNSPMLTITDVCLQSGFGDLSHFEKTFKRYTHCTPRQYRNRYRNLKHHGRTKGHSQLLERAC